MMNLPTERRNVRRPVVEAAAKPTIERIQDDAAAADGQVRKMLLYLSIHLLEPELNVEELKRRTGTHDNSITLQFHAQVGQSPAAYIASRRHAVGRRLLLGTDLAVWKVALVLGFSSIQVYSRSFLREHGMRPTEYRELPEHQTTQPVCGELPIPETPLHQLDRLLKGEGTAEEAFQTISTLSLLYGGQVDA